jgi:hypothetical protein
LAETAKIIGQDKLLEKEVYPRLKKSIPFIVTGQRGIGKSEIVRNEGERVSGEEINIAPVFLIVVAGSMLVRYIGRGMGEQDLYLLGGMGMAAGLFIRYFISKAERSK